MKRKVFKLLRKQVNDVVRSASLAANKNGLEICGFLVDNGHFIDLVLMKNKQKSGGGFFFYKSEVRSIQKTVKILGHEIIGTFHSHPAYISEPSESDILNTLDDSFMLIIDVTGKKLGMWYIKDRSKKKVKYILT